jgi:type VI secretion system secreted protein Hcp
MPTTCFLKLELENGEVKGSCTIAGHEDQIQLLGWSQSFNQPATGASESAFGGMATSCAVHQPLVISKYLDKSSGAILKACWRADYIKKMTIMSYQASGADSVDKSNQYLKVEAENGIITDYHISDSTEMPQEQFTVKYQKITYTFTPLDNETGAAGSAEPVSHDLSSGVVA